jgi:hypothetical protein
MATLISILIKDYLLEDKQGLSMGDMLTVILVLQTYSFDFGLSLITQVTRH